jgi:hypothetical protein
MLKHDSAPGNLKRAIMEIVGLPEEGMVTADLCEKVLNPNTDEDKGEVGVSPLAGTILDVVATNTKTRAGNDFTLCSFSYRDPETALPELAHRPRPAAPVEEAPEAPAATPAAA